MDDQKRNPKIPAKLLDCITGEDLDNIIKVGDIDNDQLEVPLKHLQANGQTNNVSFKTLRNEKWKDAILAYFGPSKTSLMKGGSVIKVTFDTETEVNCTAKINIYKTGSIVIQGQQCVYFADTFFSLIKNQLDDNNNTLDKNANITFDMEETIPMKTVIDQSDSKEKSDIHDINSQKSVDNGTVTPTKHLNRKNEGLTPRERVALHSKTIESKFDEIHSILSTVNSSLRQFSEKLVQLNDLKDHIPHTTQSFVTKILSAQKADLIEHWKAVESKLKHCNSVVDSLHVKSNVIDNQLKQVMDKQLEQNENIQVLTSVITKLQDRVELLENSNTRNSVDLDNYIHVEEHEQGKYVDTSSCPKGKNQQTRDDHDTRTVHEREVVTSDKPKTECDILILGDSILRRIQPKRFTPTGKTIVRFIRGGASTCTSFINKNGDKYIPKQVLLHIGARDMQTPQGIQENDFLEMIETCISVLKDAKINVLPILYRKDFDHSTVDDANEIIAKVCRKYPQVTLIEKFHSTEDMFHDDVHLNFRKGLPAIVRHLKAALKIGFTPNNRGQQNQVNHKPYNNYRDARPSGPSVNFPLDNRPNLMYSSPQFQDTSFLAPSFNRFRPPNVMPWTVSAPPFNPQWCNPAMMNPFFAQNVPQNYNSNQ